MTEGIRDPEFTVVAVSAEAIRRVRGDTLRPGLPLSASVYPQDDLPETVHLAALASATVVSCLTLFPEPYETEPAWRLRGMATVAAWRGRGCGRALLRRAVGVVQVSQGKVLWCNARTSALDFYCAAGFVIVGPEFVTEAGVPHRVGVWRASATEN